MRRLRVQDSLRIVTTTAGRAGAGKTTTVVNLAVALACGGKKVLVIDENVGVNNICATLGLNAHRDLLDVIRRDKTVEEVIVTSPQGFCILPAGLGMRVLGALSPGDQTHLIGAFASIAQGIDVILIDGASGRTGLSLLLALSSHEIVVVVSPEPASITAAYALIKHISSHHEDKRDYHVLVNKASVEAEARTIFDNMESVAKRYLAVKLHFMGFVPYDGKHCVRRTLAGGFSASALEAAFGQAAESLTCWPCEDGEGRGLERFMQRLLQSSQNSRPYIASTDF